MNDALQTFEALVDHGWMLWKGVHRREAEEKVRRALAPYTQLEIEHCIEAEDRWGESFVEAIHDLERAELSDVLEEFWTIYGRHPDGRAEALHDTGDHTQAFVIAMMLSRVAFNHIPVVDNSPEGRDAGET